MKDYWPKNAMPIWFGTALKPHKYPSSSLVILKRRVPIYIIETIYKNCRSNILFNSEYLWQSTFFKVRDVSVRDKTGLNRTIRVRYTPQYHVENNDWGEFQVFFRIVYCWK